LYDSFLGSSTDIGELLPFDADFGLNLYN